ncbi:hypothetical protein KSP39_PZI016800 [Platanthera zijinensis]|uniref:Uncharacterized protein n=1 Tax=Platanthera zijinensis TaxID=2320716 RepID=A0AAP0B7E4_9ASPA
MKLFKGGAALADCCIQRSGNCEIQNCETGERVIKEREHRSGDSRRSIRRRHPVGSSRIDIWPASCSVPSDAAVAIPSDAAVAIPSSGSHFQFVNSLFIARSLRSQL